jgi:Ca2+/Na+ antiporter
VTLSRNGYNEAAMSGAIGSQVINLSLGVGMPLFVLCLNNPSHTVELSTESSTR